MDARLWHQQATTPARALPTPVTVEAFDDMSQDSQDAYWEHLTSAMAGLVLPSVLAQDAAAQLTRLVHRNQLRPPGAKAIGSLIDYTPRYPGTVFANAIWNFRPTVEAIVADVAAGKPVGRDYTEYSFMKYGGNDIIFVADEVPADAVPAMEAKKAEIKSGAFQVPIGEKEPA